MDENKSKELRAAFPPASVGKLPKGGVMLDYVGHAAVVDRLLTVDPEWNWEPMGVDEHGLPAIDQAGNLWIRLTVCGITRIGVGDGKTMKERISDALRNAAMRFGVALELWSKEELESSAAERESNGQPAQMPDQLEIAKNRAWHLIRLTRDQEEGLSFLDAALKKRGADRETATAAHYTSIADELEAAR